MRDCTFLGQVCMWLFYFCIFLWSDLEWCIECRWTRQYFHIACSNISVSDVHLTMRALMTVRTRSSHRSLRVAIWVVAGSLSFIFLLWGIQIWRPQNFQALGTVCPCPIHATYQQGHVLQTSIISPLTYVGQPNPNFLSQHLRNPRRSRFFPALYQAFPLPPSFWSRPQICFVFQLFAVCGLTTKGKIRLYRIWRPLLN